MQRSQRKEIANAVGNGNQDLVLIQGKEFQRSEIADAIGTDQVIAVAQVK